MLKGFLRFFGLFVAMILIGGTTAWFLVEHRPAAPGQRRLVLQVTENGRFKLFQATFLAADGRTVETVRSGFHREYIDIPAEAVRVRIGEQVVAPTPPAAPPPKTAKGAPRTPPGPAPGRPVTWQTRLEAAIPPAEGAQVSRLSVDIDPAFDVSQISAWEAMVSSQGLDLKVGGVFVLFVAYFVFVLTPLGVGCMFYVLWRERTAGIRREFTGSWYSLLGGLIWLGMGVHFGVVQKWLHPEGFFSLVGLFLLPGYPLYYFSQLDFDRKAARARRAANNAERVRESETYTYTDTYDASGRKVGSDRAAKALGAFFGLIILFLLTPLFLPLVTYGGVFVRFTLPIFLGQKPWLKRPPAPAAELAGED
jgi:hypothetical protein